MLSYNYTKSQKCVILRVRGGVYMILFHSGIIKGKIISGKLKIIDERLLDDAEEFVVDPSSIMEFLEDHDFRYSMSKKTNTILFTKNLMDNRLEEYLNITGIKKSELARRIGTERTYVAELCKSKNIEIETAYKILAALSLDPENINELFPLKNKHLIRF